MDFVGSRGGSSCKRIDTTISHGSDPSNGTRRTTTASAAVATTKRRATKRQKARTVMATSQRTESMVLDRA